MFRKEETWLHFVGIGGIGMSGIAEVFLNQGYQVSGSDWSESETTKRLAQLGARVFQGHSKDHVGSANVVVISSAVKPDNPEVVEAKARRIPIIPRAEMLGELMRGKVGIAVAGSHGKTTTTSLLSTVLTSAGLDPTLVIGGKVDSLGGNAKLGRGEIVVAEADESDGSFLHLPATIGIITNIDNDHLDHFGSLSAVEDAFVELVSQLPFYGLAVICGDDPGVKRCMSRWSKPYQTYGLSEECDLFARKIEYQGLGSTFEVVRKEPSGAHQCLGQFQLKVPGQHNVLNALACILVALKLEVEIPKIAQGLAEFQGVKRRFDIRYSDELRHRAIVDDYAHHPTELMATLEAARRFWKGRIISVFQPHRYSRTLHCHDGFLSSFVRSDVVILTDIYPAGEEPIPGVSAQGLAEEIQRLARADQVVLYGGDLKNTETLLSGLFKDGDLILCLGAGSITKLPDQLTALRMKSG
ncbi:MAG: UDP-N-acetylmuramate--L-alanine ligase [Bdellovibrionia bacterium]